MEVAMLKRLELIMNHIQELKAQALRCMEQLENNGEAEVIAHKLETSINRFTSDLHNYFRICTDPAVDDISAYSEIQLSAEEVLSELTIKLRQAEKNVMHSTSKTNNINLSCKLPKLNLPEFEGNILEWAQFWDQFESNIGNRNLAEVDKLLYLKSSLKGDARKTIEGLETTNKNYQIAVTTLKERYGKPNQIIDAHYSALYKTKIAKILSEARNTLNDVEKHLRVLETLGENINHNHLRFLIMEKFPEDIVYEMRMKIQEESIEEIRKHLKLIITAREDAMRITKDGSNEEYTTQNLHVSNFNTNRYKREFKDRKFIKNKQENVQQKGYNRENSWNSKQDQRKRHSDRPEVKKESPPTKKFKLQCVFCDGSHYNDKCEKVKSIKDKKEKLKGKCYYCFNEGHMMKMCHKKVSCVHCKSEGKHNRALCPTLHNTSTKGETSTSTLHVMDCSNIL